MKHKRISQKSKREREFKDILQFMEKFNNINNMEVDKHGI